MRVSLYCGADSRSRHEPPPDSHTEIEFTPSYVGDGVDCHVYYKAPDGKRERLTSRPMSAAEVKQTAIAMLALLQR